MNLLIKVVLIFFISFIDCFGVGLNFSSRSSTVKVSNGTLNVSNPITNWTGTLEKIGNVSGAPINFNNGILNTYANSTSQGMSALVTGLYNADNGKIFLDSNNYIKAAPGTCPISITVLRDGNRLEGSPVFSNANAITLQNQLSELTLAVQNKVDSNILLNSGTLTLDNDLNLGNDKNITGSGTVNLNNKRLSFGGSDLVLTHTISWNDATDLEFFSKLSLSGLWKFGSSNSEKDAHVVGNGNTLDLTNRGTISIKAGTSLYLTDIKIKGLGLGGFAFEDKNSTIHFSDATIEMSNNYTVTQGGLYIDGDTTIITKGAQLKFDLAGSMTVDGVTLFYDTLGRTANNTYNNLYPFPDNTSKFITLLNGGTIRRVGDVTASAALAFEGTTPSLNENLWIDTNNKIIVASNKTVDGKNHFIHFSRDANLIKISSGATLTLNNVVLKDFAPLHIDQTGGGTIIFGTGTMIEIAETKDSLDLNYTWSFGGTGNCIIDGHGAELCLHAPDALSVISTATLTLQNLTIRGVGTNATNIKCLNPNGTIALRNSNLLLGGNFTFDNGYLNFYPDVLMRGANYTFNYTSPKISGIKENAKLIMDQDLTFKYNPSSANRTAFGMAPDSILYLNGCSLIATATGLELSQGNLFIDNKVTVSSQALSNAEAIHFKNKLNIQILAGALLDIYGRVKID